MTIDEFNIQCNLTKNSSTQRRMKMTALWIAVGFIVGGFFGITTMCLVSTAKAADKAMGIEDKN